MTNQTLAQISVKIKAVEKKKFIGGAIEIGKLLHEAEELCKHGEYMKWVKSEFGWSHQTALNYRDVYDLSQNPKILEFDKLDISISALYLITDYFLNQTDPDNECDQDELAKGMAVIEAARQRRVSYKEARKIIKETEDRLNDEKPKPEPKPEPVDDESSDDDKPEPDDDEDDNADDEPELDDDKLSDDEPEPDDDADEPDDENEDAPNEREIADALERLDSTLWGRPTNFDWQKVIEIVSAEKIRLIVFGLTTILDQNKASQPPEPTTRTKKQKEKESVH